MIFRIIEHGTPEYEETVALRNDVLRAPLGLHFTPEQLGAEGEDIHLACYDDDRLVACLILSRADDRTVKMRQVAVAPEMQGRGVGRALVERSEAVAREQGFATMTLHARDTAVPFYLRLGYQTEGEPFEEVSIPHRTMVKQIGEER